MPKKKMGRPLSGEQPRNINLGLRISQQESELIQECADKLQTSRIDVIIRGVKLLKESLNKQK